MEILLMYIEIEKQEIVLVSARNGQLGAVFSLIMLIVVDLYSRHKFCNVFNGKYL
jgi:hypothetical protein